MPGSENASDAVVELACMSALAGWLSRWKPISIHRAILARAQPEAVAAACCKASARSGCTAPGTPPCP